MENIYIGGGIMDQIKDSYYIDITISRKGAFENMMKLWKDFYKEYPYAARFDYEKFCREILDYYE